MICKSKEYLKAFEDAETCSSPAKKFYWNMEKKQIQTYSSLMIYIQRNVWLSMITYKSLLFDCLLFEKSEQKGRDAIL